MLYHFDRLAKTLDPLNSVSAAGVGVLEKEIEVAVAGRPECIVRTGREGSPLLIVKKSVAYETMPDIIALDTAGRLVLVECKRGWATRDSLAQLLDYASEYNLTATLARLKQAWATGEGKTAAVGLIEKYRSFTEDDSVEEAALGVGHVLVVVAAGHDAGFTRIATYLRNHGVPVYFVPVRLFRRAGSGELFLDVEPIDLTPAPEPGVAVPGGTTWMINTDETHSPGAHERFIARGVAAIWGYPDGASTLQQGAQAGDVIYAYRNGVGIVARGVVVNGDVVQAAPENSAIPECKDGNEWHLAVKWTPLAKAVSNTDVRKAAGAGLPVRNTFCRLWNGNVRKYLAARAEE